jgi:hypothetical protein
MELSQDGTRYFDYHHSPDDTLDKVDPEQLRQNVAAWTTMLSIVANELVEFGPVRERLRGGSAAPTPAGKPLSGTGNRREPLSGAWETNRLIGLCSLLSSLL